MSILVENGFEIFTDISGKALEGGYIHIGEYGLNPLSNPQAAYWDKELTIPATDVRTKQGYPLNGTAVGRLYVAGLYSIEARDKNGTQVYINLTAGIKSAGRTWSATSDGSLKMCLPFDEGDGTVAHDVSGNGNDGTLTGFGPVAEYHFDGDVTDETGTYNGVATDITYEAGVVGQAAVFNGTTSKVVITIPAQSAYCISFWANKTRVDRVEGLLGITDGVNSPLRFLAVYGDTYEFDYTPGEIGNLQILECTTGWHHFILSHSGTDMRLYYDNNLADSGIVTYELATSGSWNIELAKTIINRHTGLIDDFRIYDYALSEAEISALYNRPQQPSHRVDGVSGKALAFNGKSKIEIASGLPAGDISISLWFNVKKGASANRYFYTQDGGSRRFINVSTADIIVFGSRLSDGATQASSFITSSLWTENTNYHIVAVQDGLTTKIYLDGVLIDSDTYASIYTSFSATGRFGTFVSTNYYDGLLDEPRIYNRALTADEVCYLYENPAGDIPHFNYIDALTGTAASMDSTDFLETVDFPSDTAWTSTTTLLNGWTGTINYIKRVGMVTITANVDGSSASSTTMLNLPSGYLPGVNIIDTGRNAALVQVTLGGVIAATTGSATVGFVISYPVL